MDELEEKGIEHLEHIEQELKEIKELTGVSRWVALRNGIFQGAGAVIGGVFAVVFIGWLLSVLGVIPGFATIGNAVQDAIHLQRIK
ncbi:MAG: hypothetical protein JWO50_282 [Candidatus Kaiserbacteria bacterium]|nr:hypothetical protein [Candidatus Kaiserbacteria bacterium]